MKLSFKLAYIAFALSIATLSPLLANIGSALDAVQVKIDKRIKDVYKANLDAKNRQQALVQLRNMQSRYNSARSLSAIPSQKEAANDMLNQLRRELNNFDRRLNSQIIKVADKRAEKKKKSD